MKKNLLFVIDSLHCAGAEKSLVTLLRLIDYTKYSVDLQLFGYGGELEKLVPNQVNILNPLKYMGFTNLSFIDSVKFAVKHKQLKMLFSRLKYSIFLRIKNYSNPQKSRLFWECIAEVIENSSKKYDIAISYAQGIPTFYVAEKIRAKKKYAWVNVSNSLDGLDKEFQKERYYHFDKIIAVSDSAKNIFLSTFPDFTNCLKVIYDINNPDFILEMANIGDGFQDNYDGIRILTIGRLAYGKGYDIALETCKSLKESGVKFKWYALGIGPLKEEIEKYISENNLTDHFILLGVKANPYTYIKQADIYVQTSRYEGFGLAIAEARMLNVPIVTTRFDAVYDQMIDGKNGLVVDVNSEAVHKGILELINNMDLKESIINYLRCEKKGNMEELEKFYQLIG